MNPLRLPLYSTTSASQIPVGQLLTPLHWVCPVDISFPSDLSCRYIMLETQSGSTMPFKLSIPVNLSILFSTLAHNLLFGHSSRM